LLIVENPGTLSSGGDRIFAMKSNRSSGYAWGAQLFTRQVSMQGRMSSDRENLVNVCEVFLTLYSLQVPTPSLCPK